MEFIAYSADIYIYIYMPLKGKGFYGKGIDYPSGGAVAGVGMIHGRLCVILANDATVKVRA